MMQQKVVEIATILKIRKKKIDLKPSAYFSYAEGFYTLMVLII
jgi:hypothetical protein